MSGNVNLSENAVYCCAMVCGAVVLSVVAVFGGPSTPSDLNAFRGKTEARLDILELKVQRFIDAEEKKR